MLNDHNGVLRGAVFPAIREPKIALIVGAIASATGFGWLLMIGVDQLGLDSICGDGTLPVGWQDFGGLTLQWLVMLMTMLLPCITPSIIGAARFEKTRYGTLTGAMAFTLGYGGMMLAPASAGALWQALNWQDGAMPGAIMAIALLIPLHLTRRRRSVPVCADAADPFRVGLKHGIRALPMALQMVCLQLVFGWDNLIAMAVSAIAMVAITHRRRLQPMLLAP